MNENLCKDSSSSESYEAYEDESSSFDSESSNSINSVSDHESHECDSDYESDLKDTRMKIEIPPHSDVAETKTIIKKLMHKLFVYKKNSVTVKEFFIRNVNLLSKLHPGLPERLRNINFFSFENLKDFNKVTEFVSLDLNKTCENFCRAAAKLEAPDNLKIIIDEIIPQIDNGIKTENEFEKREMFRKFLGHFLWFVDFCNEFDTVRKEENEKESSKYSSTLYHRAAEYFKNYEEIWLEVAKFHYDDVKDVEAAIDTLKKGLEHRPDSVKLSLNLACVESISYKETSESETEISRKIQEFIDHALISYADNGFEIKPIEWIEKADETVDIFHFDDDYKFTYTVVKSIVGLVDDSKYSSPLYHRTVEYLNNNEEIWLRVAIFQYDDVDDVVAAIDTLKKGLEHRPDSVKLSLNLACFESISYKETSENETEISRKIQEFIDHALISYADNGFEIKPIEWIKQIDKTVKRFDFDERFGLIKFISALMKSIVGLGDEKEELEKFLNQNSYRYPEKFYLIRKVQARPKNKRLWIQAIFHEETDGDDDCRLLIKTACEHFPSDVNLRNLIYAKFKWDEIKFLAADRLFKIAIADDGWKRKINEIYEKFQDKMRKVRAARQELYQQIIDLDPSDEKAVEDVLGKEFSLTREAINRGLEDELIIDEYEIVQEVLTKLLLIEPNEIDLCFIKAQVEMKLRNLDQAAATFKAGNRLLEWAHLEEKRGHLSEAREILERARAESSYEDRAWIASICFYLRANEKDEAQTLLAKATEIFPESGKLWAEAIFMEDGTDGISRELKLFEANGKCNKDKEGHEYILLSAAKLKLIDGNTDEAREWFNTIVGKYPNFGDAWIYFYKLEKLWGSEESSREVLIRFIEVTLEYDYVKGELWYASQDHIDNWSLTREELLILTANRIDFYSI